MAAALDPGILADFLVEAGELVGGLSGQLLELEAAPTEPELLNAVFRAFHTIKGGAGFLGVTPMVELCHRAEDLLNEARAQRVVLAPGHLDALLAAVDSVQAMLAALGSGEAPLPAVPALLQQLAPALAHAEAASIPAPAPAAASGCPVAADRDPVEDEFEALLAAAAPDGPVASAPPAAAAGAPVDDAEFEAMLDRIYGSDGAPGRPATGGADAPPAAVADPSAGALGEDEFEALLDQLHGPGKAPGRTAGAGTDAPPSAAADAAQARPLPPPPARSAAPPAVHETTVRVDTARLDALMNLIGELVLMRNRFSALALSRSGDAPLERAAGELDRVTGDLQGAVMATRMQPVARLFQRFPRIVRDLARQLGKEVALQLEGEDTNLDRSLVESLADPLVHLVRNALDHGLELPAQRLDAGKPRAGVLRLAAAQEGERIVISIADDGRGMDAEVLRRKAVEKGLLARERAAALSTEECHELIFLPGFSTASQVSDISGRGVGMDVVKTRLAELGGAIALHSRLGIGTTIRLALPLTLAILRALRVRVGERLLALPLAQVAEVFELSAAAAQQLDGREVVAHRGRPLPLLRPEPWLGLARQAGARLHVVVVEAGHHRVGLVVHAVEGREDAVIKPLGPLFRAVSGIAGATVTGDGRIALVLDVAGLLRAGAHAQEGATWKC